LNLRHVLALVGVATLIGLALVSGVLYWSRSQIVSSAPLLPYETPLADQAAVLHSIALTPGEEILGFHGTRTITASLTNHSDNYEARLTFTNGQQGWHQAGTVFIEYCPKYEFLPRRVSVAGGLSRGTIRTIVHTVRAANHGDVSHISVVEEGVVAEAGGRGGGGGPFVRLHLVEQRGEWTIEKVVATLYQ
jgi:hypothetical protein